MTNEEINKTKDINNKLIQSNKKVIKINAPCTDKISHSIK
jgi:hypothetical protein